MIRGLLIYGLLIVLCLTACEREIEIDLPVQPELVILSNFSPENSFQLSLTTTKPIDNQNAPISFPEDATIQLFENGTYIEDFTFQPTDSTERYTSYYSSDYRPETQATYSIVANLAGYPEAKAENTVPEKIVIDQFDLVSANYILDDRDAENPDPLELRLYDVTGRLRISEQSTSPQYFHLTAWRNFVWFYTVGNDTMKEYSRERLELEIADDISHIDLLHEEGILIDSRVFAENPEGISINFPIMLYPEFELKSPIHIEVRHISEDYYLFHKSVEQQEFTNFNESFLSTQSVLIHSNVEDGVGYFGAYNTTEDSLGW